MRSVPLPAPRRLRGAPAAAIALVVLAAAVAAAAIAVPGTQADGDTGYIAQALAQAVAAVACLGAARTASGAGRLAWGLLCAGQALSAATNLAFAIVDALAVPIPEVSAFDVLWLAYYVPTLGAVAVFYRRRRPEVDWTGMVDALILTGAVTVLAWEVAILPLAATGAGGVEGAAVNTLYPTLDLLGLSVMAWLAMRQAGRPRWLVWISGSFLSAVVAGGIYLRAALLDSPSGMGVSAAFYVLAAACLVVAADQRRTAGPGDLSHLRVLRPRPWVQIVPFVLAAPLLVLVADGRRGAADTAAVAIIAVVVARLSWALIRLDALGRENERLLVTDPLTGAYNRRFLSEELARLSARARRDGAPLAVVMLDLDGFKLVNDTLGHEAGDAFLRWLVARLRVRLRGGDVLCRMGGDEFVLLLPGTDEDGALRLTERLQGAVAEARANVCPDIPVGGSFGAVAQDDETRDPETLLKRADAAMYAAKRAGGARTLAWRGGRRLAGR